MSYLIQLEAVTNKNFVSILIEETMLIISLDCLSNLHACFSHKDQKPLKETSTQLER